MNFFAVRRLISFYILLVLAVAAQTPDTASIRGTVRDQSGAVVNNAEVTLLDSASQYRRTTLTSESGTFNFSGLPGLYTISAAKAGFQAALKDALSLAGGTSADISLQLNVLGQQTSVQVIGNAGGIRTDEPQLGQYIASAQANDMPLLNRRITYLPLLNAANRPAINQGDIFMNEELFTTNGAGRRQTWFEIDGASGSDSWAARQFLATCRCWPSSSSPLSRTPFPRNMAAPPPVRSTSSCDTGSDRAISLSANCYATNRQD
jgi:hypothetical protein